jgi:hypothetical protein
MVLPVNWLVMSVRKHGNVAIWLSWTQTRLGTRVRRWKCRTVVTGIFAWLFLEDCTTALAAMMTAAANVIEFVIFGKRLEITKTVWMVTIRIAQVYTFLFGMVFLATITLDMRGAFLAFNSAVSALSDWTAFLGYEDKWSICATVSTIICRARLDELHLYEYIR